MNPAYALRDTSDIFTPALVFYKELIRRNIVRAVEIAGNPSRLRPHAKTHKTREIVRLEMDAGNLDAIGQQLVKAQIILHEGVGWRKAWRTTSSTAVGGSLGFRR